MRGESIRCYSICRRCAAVYPEGRRCPACDGDAESARVVREATTCAMEAARMSRRKTMTGGALVITSVVAVSLAAGIGVLALALV